VHKPELIDALAERAGLARPVAAKVVNVLFGRGGILPGELAAGRSVTIAGFGTFEVRRRAARRGRDPRSGNAIALPGSLLPAFRTGAALKAAVNRRRG